MPETQNSPLERAAATLDDLALALMTESDDNPTGNALAASIVLKCAEIVRMS